MSSGVLNKEGTHAATGKEKHLKVNYEMQSIAFGGEAPQQQDPRRQQASAKYVGRGSPRAQPSSQPSSAHDQFGFSAFLFAFWLTSWRPLCVMRAPEPPPRNLRAPPGLTTEVVKMRAATNEMRVKKVSGRKGLTVMLKSGGR